MNKYRLIALIIFGAILLVVAACSDSEEVVDDTATPAPTAIADPVTSTANDTSAPVDPSLIDEECDCVANEIIVLFSNPEPSGEVQEILNRFNAVRIKENFDLGGAWVLQVPRENREGLLAELVDREDVEYAERNFVGGGS